MTAPLQTLIARCRAEHACKPGASPQEIQAAEVRIGFPFTAELPELLQACNGIGFWAAGNYPCRLLSLQEIVAARDYLSTDDGPSGLIALLAAASDCVAIGLDRAHASYGRIVDCSHETFPYELSGVCESLQDMLTLVLDSDDEEWIWPAACDYGVDYAA
ncbi:MAG TPA: SMI1/KNR4 family protein [Burkholderiaceae bacterium]|nr:SMI1/KNR4 family protein [Burkholderiaceae bacterium]